MVKEEDKFLTYRIGGKFDFLQVGDTINARNSSTKETFAIIEITDKYELPFKDLPIDAQGHEVYPSKEDQKQQFEKFYPGRVNEEVIVTVIGFKLIQKLW